MQRFTKGQRVLVIGRLEISEWQTREGEKRTSYDIWADDVVKNSAALGAFDNPVRTAHFDT